MQDVRLFFIINCPFDQSCLIQSQSSLLRSVPEDISRLLSDQQYLMLGAGLDAEFSLCLKLPVYCHGAEGMKIPCGWLTYTLSVYILCLPSLSWPTETALIPCAYSATLCSAKHAERNFLTEIHACYNCCDPLVLINCLA